MELRKKLELINDFFWTLFCVFVYDDHTLLTRQSRGKTGDY
jgi:hypothetical protein